MRRSWKHSASRAVSARWTTRFILLMAALPLFQFFTGCFPNIPGLANLPGAISVETQSLIITTVVNAVQVVISNLLNL